MIWIRVPYFSRNTITELLGKSKAVSVHRQNKKCLEICTPFNYGAATVTRQHEVTVLIVSAINIIQEVPILQSQKVYF